MEYRIRGYLDTALFQQCSEAAQYLNAEYADVYRVSIAMELPFEFERFRETLDEALHKKSVLVHASDTVISGDEFLRKVIAETNFKLFDVEESDPQSYVSLARANHRDFLKRSGCSFAWISVSVDEMPLGRILFQLYSDACPKTVQNFLHLCEGDLPKTTDSFGESIALSYKGSSFYRTVKGGWIQGGDISSDGKGNHGHSIFGHTFPDESFAIKHDDAGIIGMVNDGEHTNTSAFYITTKRNGWMDGRYVAFGRVVQGQAVVDAIHDVETKHNQQPLKTIRIEDCGVLSLD